MTNFFPISFPHTFYQFPYFFPVNTNIFHIGLFLTLPISFANRFAASYGLFEKEDNR